MTSRIRLLRSGLSGDLQPTRLVVGEQPADAGRRLSAQRASVTIGSSRRERSAVAHSVLFAFERPRTKRCEEQQPAAA